MYRLHCFCQSGNSFKIAVVMNCMGQRWEAVFVDYLAGETKRPEWRERWNEMGEVPVLEDGPLKLTQSGVILRYLSDKHRQFGGADQAENREVLRWLLYDNHKISSYLASYRYMKAFASSAPDPAVMGWLGPRILQAMATLEKRLTAQPFLVGPRPTIADISACAYLVYPEEETGLRIVEQHPALRRWLDRLRALPGWFEPYDVLPGYRVAPRW